MIKIYIDLHYTKGYWDVYSQNYYTEQGPLFKFQINYSWSNEHIAWISKELTQCITPTCFKTTETSSENIIVSF